MRAVVLAERGGTPAVREWPEPEAGPGEVKVRLRAAALNHRDVWIARGLYPGVAPPVVLGSDGVGELDGRRVVVNPALDWGPREDTQGPAFSILGNPRDGTFAEAVVVPEENVYACPEHLTDQQAAAIPLAGLTAWRALVTRAAAKPGDAVLVTGAGGGVSSFAIQFAVALGCRVYVTSSRDEKIAAAVALGAEGGVRYTEEGWGKRLRALSGGIDAVVDGAGGAGFAEAMRSLNPAARVAYYGGTAGGWAGLMAQATFYKQVTLAGTTMGSPREFAAMLAFVAEHGLRPVVDSVRPLAEAPAAFARMAAGEQRGKLVLAIA